MRNAGAAMRMGGAAAAVGLGLALAAPGLPRSARASGAEAPGGGERPSPFGLSDPENLPAEPGPPSIGRADLYACGQLAAARALAAGDVDRGRFARALTGTWVRELTWYGVPVPTESVLYFDLDAGGGVAMMVDLVSLGLGPMSRRVDAVKNSLALRAVTPTLTYLLCEKGIRDAFFKVSDGFLFDGLHLEPDAGHPLPDAWRTLNAQGFFDRTGFALPARLAARPGSELLTPSVVGAFWRVRLQPVAIAGRTGARMRLAGEYRGSHWQPGQVETGVESGDFLAEGELYVAASSHAGDDRSPAEGNYINRVDPNAPVPMERVVLDPAGPAAPPSPPPAASRTPESGRAGSGLQAARPDSRR